jgi:putative membrane protein (TIGR04086 family)
MIKTKKEGISTQRLAYILMKSVAFGYIVTVIMLSVMALLMYKFDLSSNFVNLGVIITLVVSTFLSGNISAKTIKSRRGVYGAISGIAYFIILLVLSILIKDTSVLSEETATIFIMCFGSGTLGGIFG